LTTYSKNSSKTGSISQRGLVDSTPSYTCVVCGYTSDSRAEFVELRDPIGVKKLNERGKKVKQTPVAEGDFICSKCSLELYSPSGQTRSIRAVCPKCGEVFEVWL